MRSAFVWWLAVASLACASVAPSRDAVAGPHDALIAKHAAAHGVPEALVRRVIHIESKGNPRVVSKGNYGLMQIRLGTAKAMGYRGTADGLLDPDTNMTYAVKYLALAYRAAGCSESGAVAYYQRGFYKKPRGKCALPRQATTQVARVEALSRHGVQTSAVSDGDAAAAAPAEVLKPRVVRVQTINRPKPAAQSTATRPAAAPMQVAAPPTLAAAGSEPGLVASAPKVRPSAPQAVAAPQTVAKAPDLDPPAPPRMAPAIPTVFMEMLPMPKPRPGGAQPAVAKLDAATASEPPPQSDVSAALSDVQVARLDPAAVPLPQPKPVLAMAPAQGSKPAHRKAQRSAREARKRTGPRQQESGLVAFFRSLTTPQQPQQPQRRQR